MGEGNHILLSMIFDIHDSASLVVDYQSLTRGWDSLVPSRVQWYILLHIVSSSVVLLRLNGKDGTNYRYKGARTIRQCTNYRILILKTYYSARYFFVRTINLSQILSYLYVVLIKVPSEYWQMKDGCWSSVFKRRIIFFTLFKSMSFLLNSFGC